MVQVPQGEKSGGAALLIVQAGNGAAAEEGLEPSAAAAADAAAPAASKQRSWRRQQLRQRDAPRTAFALWRPGHLMRLWRAFVSPPVRVALQFVAGQLLVNFFVLVRRLSFAHSCLVALFYGSLAIVFTPDPTLGARIMASAAFLGAGWIGVVLAGAALSLARAPGVAFTVFSCITGAAAVGAASLLRASPNAGTAGCGVAVQVFFGVAIIQGQATWPAGLLWKNVLLEVIADGALAALANVVVGALLLPDLASARLRVSLASTIQALGHSVSGYAGVLFEGDAAGTSAAAAAELPPLAGLHDPWVDADRIHRATDPGRQKALAEQRPPNLPRAADLRPKLLLARAAARHAGFEPACLRAGSLKRWGRVLDSLDSLLTRVACLESALEGVATAEGRLLRLATLQRQAGLEAMPGLRAAFAHVAAACAVLATAVRQHTDPAQAAGGLRTLTDSWGMVEARMAAGLHDMQATMLQALPWDEQQHAVAYRHMPELRGVYYVAALASGIIEATVRLERDVAEALGQKHQQRQRGGKLGLRTHSGRPDDSVDVASIAPPNLLGSFRPALSVDTAAWRPGGDSSASMRRNPAADRSSSRRSESFLRHRLRQPAAHSSSSSSIGSSTDDDARKSRAAASKADIELGMVNGSSGRQQNGLHRHGDSTGSGSGSDGGSSASEDYLRHRLRPQTQQQQQPGRSDPQPQHRYSGNPAAGSFGHSARGPDLAGGDASNSLHCSTPGAPDADGMSSLGADSPTATLSLGTPQSSDRQLPIRVGRASLEGMALRPLQNIPMSTFLQRSRSHPSIVTLQDRAGSSPVADLAADDMPVSPTQRSLTVKSTSQPSSPASPAAKPSKAVPWHRKRRRRRRQQGGTPHTEQPQRRGRLGKQAHACWAYLRPIVLGLSGLVAFRRWAHILQRGLPAAVRDPKALARRINTDRQLQFGLKYFLGSGIAIVLILALQGALPALRGWRLLFGYFTVAVVLSEKVETTMTKGIFRVVTTAVGGIAAFGVMAHPSVAGNPYILSVILLAFDFIVALWMSSQFKYAVFLMVITFNLLVLCQHVAIVACTAPTGCPRSGSIQPFYAQTAAVGCAMAGILAMNLIRPWYASDAALELLGFVFQEAAELMVAQGEAARYEMAASAGRSALQGAIKDGAAPLPGHLLQERIVQPLACVQQTLAAETVAWRRGILVMPPAVHELLEAALALTDKLAAMSLVLCAKPIVAGRFSATPWTHYMQPLTATFRPIYHAVSVLGAAVAAFLCRRGGSVAAVQAAIAALEETRLAARQHQQEVVREFFTLVRVTTHPGSLAALDAGSGGGGDGPPPATSGQPVTVSATAAAAAVAAATMKASAPDAELQAAAAAEARASSATAEETAADDAATPDAASARRQMAGRTPDDHMRFSSYSFAITEQLDKLTLMARVALLHEDAIQRPRHWLAPQAAAASGGQK